MFPTTVSPKVSIIMPTYNRAAYIQETIESIRSQTYCNWELLIIDDGSDDNTEEMIARLKDNRIQFHKAGRIGIGGKIKNIGLDKAMGELIAFIDSDDLWHNTKMEKQVVALQEHPEAGFSMTGGYNFRQKNRPIEYFYKERSGIKYGSIFISIFKSEIAGFTQTLMLRKDCISSTGAFKESKSFSDVDFIINLARHFKALILYEPLVFRRLHDTNWSDPNWIKSNHEGIEIIRDHKNQLPRKVVRDALFRLYINFGENYLKRQKRTMAISKFIIAWRYHLFSIVPIKKIGKAVLKRFV
ncbi:MAG: glycosyltransferase family 2 protein [Chitinophagaceae bacterium]|nr:glycosyltransferase family 2 protein [Chitinophagaceae bacterium]